LEGNKHGRRRSQNWRHRTRYTSKYVVQPPVQYSEEIVFLQTGTFLSSPEHENTFVAPVPCPAIFVEEVS
jgi:hypothetical protein